MGTIDMSDEATNIRNYNFLKDLPVNNPKNFSNCSRELILKKIRPQCVHHVPLRPNEKRIATRRVPLVLSYLKNHWNLFPLPEKTNNNRRGQKREHDEELDENGFQSMSQNSVNEDAEGEVADSAVEDGIEAENSVSSDFGALTGNGRKKTRHQP